MSALCSQFSRFFFSLRFRFVSFHLYFCLGLISSFNIYLLEIHIHFDVAMAMTIEKWTRKEWIIDKQMNKWIEDEKKNGWISLNHIYLKIKANRCQMLSFLELEMELAHYCFSMNNEHGSSGGVCFVFHSFSQFVMEISEENNIHQIDVIINGENWNRHRHIHVCRL